MALDNANFIAELSITDPPGTDPLSQGDDQIRTIKRATQQSFPNIDAAVTLTAAQMNLAAIKNETNVFTVQQTIQDQNLILDAVADVAVSVEWRRSSLVRWQLAQLADASVQNLTLARFDAGGLFIDNPFTVGAADGVVDFAHVPTVKGSPLWVAGEIKMIVVGGSLPGGNWFIANGTNGTVNLGDRFLAGIGATFAGGPQGAFLAATADAGVTGSTAITSTQMPSHRHKLRDLQTGGGISDGTALSNANSVGSIRNVTANIFTENSLSGNLVENTGGGAGHTHTSPAQNVEADNTGAAAVMPFAYFLTIVQFVP